MTRLEENQMVINEMARRVKDKPTGTYQEMVTFQLGAIASMLGDISKSLAIIADDVEKKQGPKWIHITTKGVQNAVESEVNE